MKITLLKDSFLEKIILASKFTSSKVLSSNILQGVCLKTEEGRLHLYATNLNSYYHTSLKIEESKKTQIVIEPKKISEFLSLVDAPKITLEIKEKDLAIEAGKTKGDFPLMDAAEFPFPPEIKEEKQKIKTDFFKKNLPILLFSASSDETRPALTGINFVTGDDGLKIVSTDGFRLSLLSLKKETSFPAAIVPASFLSEAMKIIKEEEISFSYSLQEKILVFYSRGEELYTRLIEGDYPPFEKVIPQDKKTTITLDRQELLRNVKLTAIFTRESSNVIILKTGKDEVIITPKTSGEEINVARQEATIEGEEQKIAFNYKFLLDFLSNVTSDKIILELLRGDAPAVFKAGNLSGFLHIIMPVRGYRNNMEKYILDTNLFFNMGAGLGLGKNTEEIVVKLTEKITKLKKNKQADFLMPPRAVDEFLSFFDDKNQTFIKKFLGAITIKSPQTEKVAFPAAVFYKLVADIRERSYRGLNIGEEEINLSGQKMLKENDGLSKKDFQIKIGESIKKFRDRYRNATRTGFLDSVADLDLIVLAREQDGYLITTDEGVLAWGRLFGVKELPSSSFIKRLEGLHDPLHQE